ncbi:MAG: nitroreductase family protein [Anaerolineae bacterium]
MDTLEAIHGRRSIRRFKPYPVPRPLIERILDATVQAPSAKNAQPWRFAVLEGERRDHLARIMMGQAEMLKGIGLDTGSLEWTAGVIAAAPVTIVVLNACPPPEVPEEAHKDYDYVMLQSAGGAIQTMLLAAHALGLGSLWICDILYAHCEVLAWLGHNGEKIVAAVTLGYSDEAPGPRPRRPWQQSTDWPDVL